MMNFKRFACIATSAALLVAGSAIAFQGRTVSKTADTSVTKTAGSGSYDGPEALSPLVAQPKPGLKARKPVSKLPVVRKPQRTHDMLIVKFGDPVVGPNAVTRAGTVEFNPQFQEAEAEVRALVQRFNLTVRHAVPHDQATLEDMYRRAEERSGKMQPNLKSYMYIEGDPANLEHVANVLNRMETVEIVSWYEDKRPVDRGAAETGACCLPDDSCDVMSMADCTGMGGTYQGDDTDCAPNPCNAGACCVPSDDGFSCSQTSEAACHQSGGYFQGDGVMCTDMDGNMICDDVDEECGATGSGSCYWIDGDNGTPYCEDEQCCELICDLDPFCCDDANPVAHFDEYCAAFANQYCAAPPADRCLAPLNESCLEAHFTGGCNNSGCCNTVCAIDEFCCSGNWDGGCVALALEQCVQIDATTDYTPLQGYLTLQSYQASLGSIPEELQNVLPVVTGGAAFTGFGGQGWFLDGNGSHDGLHGLGQELIDVYNTDEFGEGVLTRGATIKVAVIEWGYWGPEPFVDANGNDEFDAGEEFSDINGDGEWTSNHEDLDVILEEGQTLIFNTAIAENDHGTACLGIINAIENGFGMTGIAPDAQAYFFPLTSVEEGPRAFAAWVSAMDELGPGDVISASYGGGDSNLAVAAGMAPILRMASDLGITSCVAAGNDCFNLDDFANPPDDTGAIVVGACSPGQPYFRLAFSNYHQQIPTVDADTLLFDQSNIVHTCAWGSHVATLGYGNLSQATAGDPHRSYTTGFGGTSAATPQIAGLVACLQGLAKQFYGIPLTPEQIRYALFLSRRDDPPPYETRLFGGFSDDFDCALDLDPDQGPNLIGVYPRVAGTFDAASSIILNQGFAGFSQSPNVQDVVILNGDHIYGSKFSIKGSDNTYFVVESERAEFAGPEVPANLPPGVPVGAVQNANYTTPGEIADILVIAQSPFNVANSMSVNAELQGPAGNVVVAFVEVYDWFNDQWEFVNVGVLSGGGDTFVGGAVFGPQRFLRPSNRQVLVRVWAANFGSIGGVGGIGGGSGGRILPYTMRYDWVTVNVSQGFASPEAPPDFR